MHEQNEEEIEWQPINNPHEGGGHSSSTSIKYQLEFQEIIDELSMTLQSKIPVTTKTNDTVWVRPDGVRPLINEKGVNNIVAILRSHLSKIFILSDLDQQTIENMTITLGRTLIDNFYFNWHEYDIQDMSDASTILHLVCNTVYATLRKSHHGNYLKFLSKTTTAQEIQHHTVRPMRNSGGDEGSNIINKIFGRRRR